MADLEITERTVFNGNVDVVILTCVGKTTVNEGTTKLRKKIRELIAEGKLNVLLNFEDMHYIDSTGIGELVSSFTAIKKEGGNLKLLSLRQKIEDLLAITSILSIFKYFDNEKEALASFS